MAKFERQADIVQPIHRRNAKSCGLARKECLRLSHAFIGTAHMLLGLLSLRDRKVEELLELSSGQETELRQALKDAIPESARWGGKHALGQVPFSPAGKNALEYGDRTATELGSEPIEPQHLVLGLLLQRHGTAAQVLREQFEIDYESVMKRSVAIGEAHARNPP